MKLLVYTQILDKTDATLGFFHTWLLSLAPHFDLITVVCLQEGPHSLPANIVVHSLGKKQKNSFSYKFNYLFRFYSILLKISGTYDQVFVHMNQEYVLLGGLLWKFGNIPVHMWRNHPYGNVLTRIAAALSTTILCTSTQSYTAQFPKTRICSAGIDTNMFVPQGGIIRKKYSLCMVGRIAPIKHIDTALVAIKSYVASGGQISLTIVGAALEKDREYEENLKKYVQENNISTYVTFVGEVLPQKLPEMYSSHEVCLNLTDSGSFDKTIVEAAGCGAIPVVYNQSLASLLPRECIINYTEPSHTPGELHIAVGETITHVFKPHIKIELASQLALFVESQSLVRLTTQLVKIFKEFEHVQK